MATEQRLVDRLAGHPLVVVSPGLLVSVTIEMRPGGGDEVHIHPAGQGYWVARMIEILGGRPVLVTTCGGEMAAIGPVLVGDQIDLRMIASPGTGGCYVDDRRTGDRQRRADQGPAPLDRHIVDDLLSATVAAGLEAGLVVITGSNGYATVKPSFFAALAAGLRAVGVTVVADLSGAELLATLDGGVDVLKLADDELSALEGLGSLADDDLAGRAEVLRERSGADVFVTCADAGAFAHTAEGRLSGQGPMLRSVESRGAGDSFTAAIAVARRAGFGVAEQFSVAMAAAATNVLRHGLGSATIEAVASLLDQVEVDADT